MTADRRVPRLAAAVFILLLAAAPAPAQRLPGAGELRRPSHALGALFASAPSDLPAVELYPAAAPGSAGAELATPGQLWALVELSFESVVPEPPAVRVEALDALSARVEALGAPVVLVVRGGHAALAEDPRGSYRREWSRFLREVARRGAGVVDWYLLADALPAPGSADDARLAAYDLKSASVILRAEDPAAGVGVRVAGQEELDLLRRAYRETGDLEPYLDAVALAASPGAAPEEAAGRLRQVLRADDPGASAWVEVPLSAGAAPAEALARAAALVASGADLGVLRMGEQQAREPVDGQPLLGALARLVRPLGPELGLSPPDRSGVEAAGAGLRWARFFDAAGLREVILYWAEREQAPETRGALLVDPTLRRSYLVRDPLTGRTRIPRREPTGDERVRLSVPLSRRPQLLEVQRVAVSPGFEAELGEAEVRTARRVTAEEIIAAHQRFVAFQRERLSHYAREGRMTLRIRYGQVGGTVDVTNEADYLWSRDAGAEWVIGQTFVNGVRLGWDEIPELPLLSQDRVMQLPLDLELDRRYRYELDGEETVDGRRCWRLRFEPLEEDVSLYRGRAWIDQRTAALVKVSSVQTELTPPLVSNATTQLFRPYEGPEGTSFWLLDELDGQQLYAVSGRNLVVLRQARFGPPRINAPGFERRQEDIYASDAQILRETPEGLKWLGKTEDGGREIVDEIDPRQLFAVGGVLHDEGIGQTLPLAGLNYTDIDFGGRGALLNVFFAGVFVNASLSDPSFLDTRLDLGVNVGAFAVPGTERVFRPVAPGGEVEEIEAEAVEELSQSVRLVLGWPLGNFVKLRGVVDLDYVNYSRADETAGDFLVPVDHLRTGVLGEIGFDRRGWGMFARGRIDHRSSWETWGLPGERPGAAAVDAAREFFTWELAGQKSFFLPLFQKIEFEVRHQAGEDLDRFSAFRFGFLGGTRLRGFGGSGLRYDRGTLAKVQYSFNIREVIRFDAAVDHGRIVELGRDDTSAHTGIGLAANFLGPWSTLVRLDVGYALASDLDPVEGDMEFLLAFLKLL